MGTDARPALRFLVQALSDKDSFVAQLAGNALRQIGQPTAEELQYLLPALDSTNDDAKAYVLGSLAVLGQNPEAEQAKDQVLRLTTDPNMKVRLRALVAVGKMSQAIGDKKAIETLQLGLGDTDRRVRAAAAEALVTGTSLRTDVSRLKEVLNRKEPEVRAPAAVALAKLGERARPAIPDLVAAAREDNTDLRGPASSP